MEQKYWALYMKGQCLLSLLATLNRHKILLFGCKWYQEGRTAEEVQTLCGRDTMLRYTYSAYLFYSSSQCANGARRYSMQLKISYSAGYVFIYLLAYSFIHSFIHSVSH
jgi:hypothetical protein